MGESTEKDNQGTQTDRQEVVLQFPYTLPTGARLEKLALRRAKVRDLKTASRRATDQVDLEVILISLICEPALTPEDLDEMDNKDYQVLQGFLH